MTLRGSGLLYSGAIATMDKADTQNYMPRSGEIPTVLVESDQDITVEVHDGPTGAASNHKPVMTKAVAGNGDKEMITSAGALPFCFFRLVNNTGSTANVIVTAQK
jgi:hypothetical protein